MAKKSASFFKDTINDINDFVLRLESKYKEGIKSGEGEIQAIVTATADSFAYIVVKKTADKIKVTVFKNKEELYTAFGSKVADEIIEKAASFAGDEIGEYADAIYEEYLAERTKADETDEESTKKESIVIFTKEKTIKTSDKDGSSKVYEESENGYQTTSLDKDGNITYVTNENHSLQLAKSDLSVKQQIEKYLEDNNLSDKLTAEDVMAANGYSKESSIPFDAVLITPNKIIDIKDDNSNIKLYVGNDGNETYMVDGVAYKVVYGNNGDINAGKYVVAVVKTNPDGSQDISIVSANGEVKEIHKNPNGEIEQIKFELKEEGIATLNSGGSISDIAQNTNFTTKELLEYNNLSLQDAKSLPIGFEVQIPKDIHTTIGEYGEIKIYENFDKGGSIFAPNEDGTKNIITYSENSDLLIKGDITNPSSISWSNSDGSFEVWEKDSNGNMYQSQITTSEGDTTNYTIDENGLKHKIDIDDNQSNSDAKNMEEQLANQKLPPINKDELEVNSGQIKNDANPTEEGSIFVENPDFSGVTTTAINQIGSLIISNNDFSNIEEILITSSVATIADYAVYGESKNFDTSNEGLDNLKGAVASFAISAYFAKNDNISDLIGIDGTFLGEFADFTVTYSIAYVSTVALDTTKSLANMKMLDFTDAFSGAVGSYLGSMAANKLMKWDTEAEMIGSSVGSAVGTAVALSLIAATGFGVVLVAFGGSFVGNIVGGIIGGLFGGSTPPPPTAEASYEFDETNLSYIFISSSSSDGGNEDAMKNIAQAFGNQLTNMITIAGGQLVDSSLMPEINISHRDKNIMLNGHSGNFDSINETMANALSVELPFMNVENADPYVLRAIHRTNEQYLDEDKEASLEELYANIALAKDYSKYQNNGSLFLDEDSNQITNEDELQKIFDEYTNIRTLEESEQKEAFEAFSNKYTIVNQKEFVDNLLNEITNAQKEQYLSQREEIVNEFDSKITTFNSKLSSTTSRYESINKQTLYFKHDDENDNKQRFYKITNELALEKTTLEKKLVSLQTQKVNTLENFDTENIKIITAIHWDDVNRLKDELLLNEHHYSEDFNKLNTYIANYNYEQHELNDELLVFDTDTYVKEIKQKMQEIVFADEDDLNTLDEEVLDILKEDDLNTLDEEVLDISKEEALSILEELGYELNIDNKTNIKSYIKSTVIDMEITPERMDELLELTNIENPKDTFEAKEDAFSLVGKSINDLQFEIKDGNLTITTNDKDLSEQDAKTHSQSITIVGWSSWSRDNSFLDLPDGSKININALFEKLNITEGSGLIDVQEASLKILQEDETLSSYLEEFEDKNIFLGTDHGDVFKQSFGNNFIVTGSGEDEVFTGAGNDTIIASKGADSFSLGQGKDTVSYEKAESSVKTSLEDGGISGIALGDSYENVENLTGSSFNDELIGNSEKNTLNGSSGDDILEGGIGADTLIGGDGNDTATYSNSLDSVAINFDNDYSFGADATGDTFSSIENINASSYSDVLVGNDDNNTFFANEGDDRVSANGGDDIIFAGSGDDYVKGDDGDDALYGEDGNDILIAGRGDDVLIGGEGNNLLYGEEGFDTAVYASRSNENQILFINDNTILIKSLDGKIKDTLQDIEQIKFKDALFIIDYENKSLVKMKNYENKNEEVFDDSLNNEKKTNNIKEESQASSIAAAVMVGTVATTLTAESSSDTISYLSDDPEEVKDLVASSLSSDVIKEKQIIIKTLDENSEIFKDVVLIKRFIAKKEINKHSKDEIVLEENDNENTKVSSLVGASQEIILNDNEIKVIKKEEIIENVDFNKEEVIISKDEKIVFDILKTPTIKFENSIIYEDHVLLNIFITNSNLNSTAEVIFKGLPDDSHLSSGVKKSDGSWYLTESELKDLKFYPGKDNSDDFEMRITTIVSDTNGKIITNELIKTITIIAVADEANFEVKYSFGIEDSDISINISSSLSDALSGVDGKERIYLTFENIPDDAILSAGKKDENGVWLLIPSDLEGLKLRPGLNNADDFTMKVTSFTIESENEDISSVSQDIFVEIHAIADEANLEVKNAFVIEDNDVNIYVSTSLNDTLDGIDGKERIYLTFENIPDDAILSAGKKDENGVWLLIPSDLEGLKLRPGLNNADDFTMKVTSFTIESENEDISSVSQDIFVEIHAIADEANLEVKNAFVIEDNDVNIYVSTSLNDTLDGIDGKERIIVSFENIPDDAVLSAGQKDEKGVWFLFPSDLEGLSLRPGLHNSDDFTIKVTSFTIESENEDISSVSEDIFVEIYAIADTPIIDVQNSYGDEDAQIALDINIDLVDKDLSEVLHIKIENIPEGAFLNHGQKDENGVWILTSTELENLTITPAKHDGSDFIIKLSAYTIENENSDTALISKDILVEVNAVADDIDLDLTQVTTNEENIMRVSEDVELALISISSSFIDKDGSEKVHYLVEGLPAGMSLSIGEELSAGIWKILPSQTDEISINLLKNNADDFTLKISAVSTEDENGHQKISSEILEVKIEAMADFANLDVSSSNGLQDTFISLDITSSLFDTDGSESLEIILEDIPSGAVLNQGIKDENGNWHLGIDELKDLKIRPEFKSIKDFTIKVRAITTESENNNQEETVKYINVDIEAIPTSANINIKASNSLEDEICNLEIEVDSSTLHLSESIYLELIIPESFSLNQGEKLSSTKWKVRTDQLENLEMIILPNYSGSFIIDVVPVIVSPNGNIRRDVISKLPVDIQAVADEVNLEVKDINQNEDSLIFLNISSSLNDLDGSENLKLYIKGVPSGAILNAGMKIEDEWVVEQKDIKALALLPQENISGSFDLEIKSLSTDSLDEYSVTKSFNININEVVDTPILNIADCLIKDAQAHLAIQAVLQDLDGSESLSITLNGIPQTASLSAGILNDDGSYTLSQDELVNLKITNLDGENFDIKVSAISSDGTSSKSIIKNISVQTQDDETEPYVFIGDLQINSDTQDSDILEFTGANDVIKSGGSSDTIYSKGGNDIIYSDTQSGFINVSFTLNAQTFLENNQEQLLINIENLPDGFISNIGNIKNGVLILEKSDIEEKIQLKYQAQEDEVNLKISVNAISTDILNIYTKTTVLNLNVQSVDEAGNDVIYAGAGDDTVYAQDGDDIIYGGSGNDVLIGGSGNDYIKGGLGADKIDAGDGDDIIVMDSEDFSNDLLVEVLNAGEGFDTLIIDDDKGVNIDMALINIESFIGGSGDDNIIGSNFDDIVRGGSGTDTYLTKDGNDTIYIDAADIQANSGNFVDAGDGFDTIYIEDSSAVTFDVSETNAEVIISGSGNDTLKNSTLEHVAIYGMNGDDIIYSSSSADTLDGGDGNDTLNYSNSSSSINVNLNTNSASGGDAKDDIISNFENIIGSDYDDYITGNSVNNIIFAGEGNNVIDGYAGENTVIFTGNLINYFNGKSLKNIISDFNETATVISDTGTNILTNINILQFDDYTVYIDGRNNSPFSYNDNVSTSEDTSLTINTNNLLANDFDIENDELKIVGVKNSNNGSVILNDDGTITFNPYENYNSSTNNTYDKNSSLFRGSAGFEYIVEDSSGSRSTSYVNVDVNAVNDAPVIHSHYFNRNSLTTGKGKIVVHDIDSNDADLNVSVISSLSFSYASIAKRFMGSTANVSGSTNISGRTIEEDGSFTFDYKGNILVNRPRYEYDMRQFTIRIFDSGDYGTGLNKEGFNLTTGVNYHHTYYDPIVIDLDNDGIEFTHKYYEEHDEILKGVSKDDAILVWDYNQDGTISSKLETSWVQLSETAQNDLEVLREIFDTNKDEIFDKNDKEWNNFALWQDKNEDGLVSDDEFTKINDSDIKQLNLLKNDKISDIEGVEEYASFTKNNGEEAAIAAVYLDITTTEEKLSNEDLLIIKEANIINEQMSTFSSQEDNIYESNENLIYVNDEENIQENIA